MSALEDFAFGDPKAWGGRTTWCLIPLTASSPASSEARSKSGRRSTAAWALKDHEASGRPPGAPDSKFQEEEVLTDTSIPRHS